MDSAYRGRSTELDHHAASSAEAYGPDRELLEMLHDAEAKVEQLRAELDRRREQRRHSREEADEEVERLSRYLEQAQVNWQAVRDFFHSAIEEYRADDAWGSGGSDGDGQAPRSAEG